MLREHDTVQDHLIPPKDNPYAEQDRNLKSAGTMLFKSENDQDRRVAMLSLAEIADDDLKAAFLLALYHSIDPNAQKKPYYLLFKSDDLLFPRYRSDLRRGEVNNHQVLHETQMNYAPDRARHFLNKCLEDTSFDVPHELLQEIGLTCQKGEEFPHSLVECAEEATAKSLIEHPIIKGQLSLEDMSKLVRFDGNLSAIINPENEHPLVNKLVDHFRALNRYESIRVPLKVLGYFSFMCIFPAILLAMVGVADIPVLVFFGVVVLCVWSQTIHQFSAAGKLKSLAELKRGLRENGKIVENTKLLLDSDYLLGMLGNASARQFIIELALRRSETPPEMPIYVFSQDRLLKLVKWTDIEGVLKRLVPSNAHRSYGENDIEVNVARALLDSNYLKTKRDSFGSRALYAGIFMMSCSIIRRCKFEGRIDREEFLRDVERLLKVYKFYGKNKKIAKLEPLQTNLRFELGLDRTGGESGVNDDSRVDLEAIHAGGASPGASPTGAHRQVSVEMGRLATDAASDSDEEPGFDPLDAIPAEVAAAGP